MSRVPAPQRDVYELDPGAYTHDALLAIAKKIYLERSTQETDGRISTPLWNEQILSMQNGARFFIRLRPDLDRKLQQIGDDDGAAALFLQQQYYGLSDEAARALLRAIRKPLQDFWYAKNITLEWPGQNLCTVEFINLVEI